MGFHHGVRVFVEPAPAPPPPPRAAAEPPPPVTTPPPAPPAPVANRQPAVQAQCNPCRIEVGRSVQIRVDGKDPDGDQLQYRWSAKGGTIADTRAAATTWTAETVPGTVPLVVTVEDGRGGVATSTINIEVIGAPVTELADVQFELNRFELRPDAIAALDRAVEALKQNPAMRLRIEGHASEEATAEYNLALGERRANAVREYLVSRGVAATRLSTVSYGETRPKYDNSREETRRLNRRAALVVEGGK
jgi:peptidoglycan-associated lipoprotein